MSLISFQNKQLWFLRRMEYFKKKKHWDENKKETKPPVIHLLLNQGIVASILHFMITFEVSPHTEKMSLAWQSYFSLKFNKAYEEESVCLTWIYVLPWKDQL